MSAHFDEQHYGFWRCDECGRTLSAVASPNIVEAQLPPPWREVYVETHIGAFHCCRDQCELDLRLRVAKDANAGP